MKLQSVQFALWIALTILLVTSCRRESIPAGKYQIMSVQFNTSSPPSGFYQTAMPVFDFREDRMLQLSADLPGGYFSDTVFKYRLRDGSLELKGKKSSYCLICEPDYTADRPSIQLFIDTEWIRTITLYKVEDDSEKS